MGIDPIAAQFAQQEIRDSKARVRAAGDKYEEESIRVRDNSDKFYNSLALFSGGTVALSVTYLGYLRTTPSRAIHHPKVLLASWIVLLVCVIASLFSVLLNSYYVHFARLRIYVTRVKEHNETLAEEMDNLPIVNLNTPAERAAQKKAFTDKAKVRDQDAIWAKKREDISNVLWRAFGWVARLSFPFGLGLLVFFAAKNM